MRELKLLMQRCPVRARPILTYGVAATAILAAAPVQPQSSNAQDAPLVRLIEAQANAVVAFDQKTLAGITARDYQEVSPVGDIDQRAAMLGFYAPENEVPSPRVTVGETTVRRMGSIALMTARITYTMPAAPGSSASLPSRALRGGYVARRVGGDWKLVSAQFTPIRTTPPPSPTAAPPPQ